MRFRADPCARCSLPLHGSMRTYRQTIHQPLAGDCGRPKPEPMSRYPFSRLVLGCVQALGWVIGAGLAIAGAAEMRTGSLHGGVLILSGLFGAGCVHAIMAMGSALFDLVDLAGQPKGRGPAPTPTPATPTAEPPPVTPPAAVPRPRPETLLEQEATPAPIPALVVSGDLPASKPLDEQDLARLERAAQDRRQR